MPRFSKLFEPIKIGKVTLKNRIAMAPMGTGALKNPDGSIGPRAIDYYMERVRGGTGLIITNVTKVENEIDLLIGAALVTRSYASPLNELCEQAHAFDARVFVQLTAGFGRVSTRYGDKPVSASAIPAYWQPLVTCRAMTTDEVEKLVKAFGTAAALIADAGGDGIELHGHEGYIFDQFTTAIWNKRNDKYGGSLRDRLRLPIEVLNEIKSRAGSDFPVQYRFGLKHYIKDWRSGALPGEKFAEAGRDIEEGLEMARLLEAAGFDALHVDAGSYDSWYWAHPPTYMEHGCMADMAARAKQAVKIPVIAVGRLEIPELAEKILAEGQADIIALGRGLLTDPYWAAKVRAGDTRDIRPCTGCHDGCMGRLHRGLAISCAVNPLVGRERIAELKPAAAPKKVLVAGGGVAGMEAARVAAVRGHRVIICEQGKSLGGHLIAASVPAFKVDIKRLREWYTGQLKRLGVEVRLNTAVTPALVKQEKPDTVLAATGSRPVIPDMPGIDRPNVANCVDVLLNRQAIGDSVAVLGGGLVGCETAVWLAQQGKKVTVIEALPEMMISRPPVPHMNSEMLRDMMKRAGVKTMTGTRALEIQADGVIVLAGPARQLVKADTVVLALGLVADNGLYDALRTEVNEIYAVGDCREPRNILGAIADGFEVGRVI